MRDSGSDVPFERLAELDKLIHEPARLSILTALSSCGQPVTTVSLSENGRRTIARYWDDLQALRDAADRWDADDVDATE